MSFSDCFDWWSQTVTTHCEEYACEEAGDGQVSVSALLWNANKKASDAGHPVQNGKGFTTITSNDVALMCYHMSVFSILILITN